MENLSIAQQAFLYNLAAHLGAGDYYPASTRILVKYFTAAHTAKIIGGVKVKSILNPAGKAMLASIL